MKNQYCTMDYWIMPASNRPYSNNSSLSNSEDDKLVGGMLIIFSTRAHTTQAELAAYLNVSKGLVSAWELGKSSIPGPLLGPIKTFFEKKLGNIDSEYEALLHARFKPLDPAWLQSQPVDKRAGLLLSCFRQLKGLTLEEFADACNTSLSTVGKWETGTQRIHSKLFINSETNPYQLQKILHLKNREFTDLLVAQWPALGNNIAADYGPWELGGALLTAWRERTGLSQAEMVKKIWKDSEVKVSTHRVVLSDWERGVKPIPLDAPESAAINAFFEEFSTGLQKYEKPFSATAFEQVVRSSNMYVNSRKFLLSKSIQLGSVLPAPKQAKQDRPKIGDGAGPQRG